MRKFFHLFCTFAIIGISLVGCSNNTGTPSSTDMVDGNQSNQDEVFIDEPEDDSISSQDDLPDIYIYTTEDHIFPMSESTAVDGIIYQVLDCKVTSEFGNRNMENLNHFYGDDGIDSSGNLINDESYVFLTIQFTNTTDSEIEILRNSKGIYFLDKDYIIRDYTCESVYIDEYWSGGTASEIFHYKLASGESITSELGWVVDNQMLEKYIPYYSMKLDDSTTDFGGSTDPDAVFIELKY